MHSAVLANTGVCKAERSGLARSAVFTAAT